MLTPSAVSSVEPHRPCAQTHTHTQTHAHAHARTHTHLARQALESKHAFVSFSLNRPAMLNYKLQCQFLRRLLAMCVCPHLCRFRGMCMRVFLFLSLSLSLSVCLCLCVDACTHTCMHATDSHYMVSHVQDHSWSAYRIISYPLHPQQKMLLY